MIKKHTFAIVFLILIDLALFYGALFGSLTLRYLGNPEGPLLIQRHIIPFAVIFPVWLVIFGAFGLYDVRIMKNSKLFLYRLIRAMTTNAVATILILYVFLPAFAIEPRRNLLLIALSATVLVFLWRFLFNVLIVRAPTSRVIFLGLTREAAELADFLLLHPQLGYKPLAFVSTDNEGVSAPLPGMLSNGKIPRYPSHKNLAAIIKEQRADTVVILREVKENKVLVRLLFDAIPLGVGVVEFPRFYEMLTGKIPLSLIGEVWFLENLVGIRKQFYEFFKRGFDVAIALIAGVPALALFPFIASAIKINSGGPVFYRQKRVGKNGNEFWVLKYRSMVKDAEKIDGFKREGYDVRHTKTGLFLRKNYLDELPQIWNILKGEMSFVGPRPERPEYVEKLKQKIPFYEMRLLVPPGITGWAQVNMEDDASVEDAPEKMQYDLYYIKNRSFILDALIALKTTLTILQRRGR